jgi:D-3-phosphoglycerate dehydrogenase
MKVLVADKFEQNGIDGLEAAGCQVAYEPTLEGDALAAAIRETAASVLVVRSTKVTAAMLDAGSLALVVRAGAGYNTIDVRAASSRGIYVSNCPGRNAVAVAELTMGLILALDRRIPDNVSELRAGRWNKKEFSKARGLLGRTLGVLGCGSIAREVIIRAASFGMPVLLWSRRFAGRDGALTGTELEELGLRDVPGLSLSLLPTPEDIAGRCDVLTVHLALTNATRGIVNRELLSKLRPGSSFVNTSRGELVDEAALADVVKSRGIRAGLDVFANEPAAATADYATPLASLSGAYGTHHIGASTEQAQDAIAAETVRIIRAFKETGRVPNVVNLARRTPATHMFVVRHHDRPGVLAHVFDQLRARNLNVQETENIVFEGAEAAVARINLDGQPDQALVDAIKSGNADVLDVQVVKLS